MQIKTVAIVLSATRYQEKSLIVKCFTKSYGLRTYFVRNAFSTKNKNLNSAYFQSLSQLMLDAIHKNKGALEYINEIKLLHAYKTLSFDFYKSSMCIFLAEVLATSIKEEEPNEKLFMFLETAFVWLDEHEFNVNYHLWFMLQLTKYFGFYPDDSDQDSLYFNPNEGGFTMQFTPNCFNEDETLIFRSILKIQLSNEKGFLTNTERTIGLKLTLRYFETPIVNFNQIKSIEILPALFQ